MRTAVAVASLLALLLLSGSSIHDVLAAETALAEAMKARDRGRVHLLLEQGAAVNTPLGDGSTALHWAAHWDDQETVARLLRAGARVNAPDDHGITPLGLACTNGSETIVGALLAAGADPNVRFATGETAFMRAVRTGRLGSVRLLLAHGADVNARESIRGQTALMWAVASNHADVVRLLLEAGADLSARSAAGFTPLLFAGQQGNVEIAEALIAAGADVNDRVTPRPETAQPAVAADGNRRAARPSEVDGSSVLQLTIDSLFSITSRLPASEETIETGLGAGTGHEELALFLLARGADPTRNGAGRTALHSAVRAAKPELVRALLAHGADPNARTERAMPRMLGRITGDEIVNLTGLTPFWLAASFADVRIMRMLAGAGADPLMPAADNTTPLMVAAGLGFGEGEDRYGHRYFGSLKPLHDAALEATTVAIELGGDVNARNDRGRTALHGAAFVGGTALAALLIERGAKLDVQDKAGETPLSIANGIYRDGGYVIHEETAQLLLRAGADPKLGVNPKRP